MKYILFFFLLAAAAFPAERTLTCTFDANNPPDETLQYVIEERQQDGTWLEVASGPASPIVYTKSVKWGNYAVRCFVRVVPDPLPRDVATDTSNEATTVIRPNAPKSLVPTAKAP